MTNEIVLYSWYALYLLGLARFTEAVREMESALEFDPLSMIINANLGMILSFSGEQDKAIEQYRKALEIDPDFVLTHYWLGMAYLGKGETDNALKSFSKGIKIGKDSPLALGYLGLVHGLRSEKSEIENILERFTQLTNGYIHPYCEALIHIALGDYDKSFILLNQAFDERDPLLIYLHSLPGLIPAL
ncbi:MAG: tetratricopeptide repeat protein, partial [Thermodesulfobacteriota bacterium]